MTLIVFKKHSAKVKHDSIAVEGCCFRYSRANVRGYAHEYRCCDDKCTARVLLNSPEGFIVIGDHSLRFDHQREFRSRKRLDIAFNLLERNVTEPPEKTIEIVLVQVEHPMTAEERNSLRVFITRKRSEILGRQRRHLPSHPATQKVTTAPISQEHPDNSFLLFVSNENDEDLFPEPRVLLPHAE